MVDVLLATYNGELYVRQQIESILQQTFSDFKLYIRDDGSSDNTLNIINDFSDERIVLIKDDKLTKGVGDNFKILMQNSLSDFILFSDQDDIWLPNKIEELYKYASENFDADIPSLVYSSGYVVDKNLKHKKLLTSFRSIIDFKDILCLNGGVQGCACLINRKALSSLLSLDFKWFMHDQAVSLFVSFFGEIHQLNKPLFLYRQHSNNVLGYSDTTLYSKIIYILSTSDVFIIDRRVYESILSFKKSLSYLELSKEKNIFLESFIDSIGSKPNFIFFIMTRGLKLKGSILRLVFKTILSNNILSRK
ncbi:glycosyltransferase family 2 protein [Photobacterium phosphoreum]|uniref:glycosyltransferase family 2 protein n=1 Tax=Photobacterium phosphoreum TaxID=659 RepID=UPI00242C690D|nr:glycosyltransferase family 2 protein [Photobacterium phosphoreum]